MCDGGSVGRVDAVVCSGEGGRVSEAEGRSSTRLGFDREARMLIYAAGTVVGAIVGVSLPYLARWVGDLPWAPFQGPMRLLGSFDPSWATWGRPAIGAALGALFAAYVIHQSPVLYVSDSHIEVIERGDRRRVPRSEVAGVYRTRNRIVVESDRGRRLFDGEVEGGKRVVRDAFLDHGYPWEAE
ncbi:MAG: YqeB family protein [Phycicoccus sp.]